MGSDQANESNARSTADGIIVLRPSNPLDVPALIAGRDQESHRWLGVGTESPNPTACIVVGDAVVGWVDYDAEREWLHPGEVNVGYNVFPAHRGRGYATHALQLLMHQLALGGEHHTATLLIDPGNDRSLALAHRTRFSPSGQIDGQRYFKRAVPPLTYSDGVVTIRCLSIDDLDKDLEAKDDEQMDWLWLPGHRDRWESMTPNEQRAWASRGLQQRHDEFGAGPKWSFAVDAMETDYVAFVDCDLANPDVPHGEANISYSSHPAHRRRGYVSRAVRLLTRFLEDHTATRFAHIVVDEKNIASLRVVHAVGAVEHERWVNDEGHTMVRHLLALGGGKQAVSGLVRPQQRVIEGTSARLAGSR